MIKSEPIRSRRRPRPAVCAAAAVLAALLALTVGEATVRLIVWARGWTPNCYAASLQLLRPHPKLGYDLAPNFRLRSGAFVTSINSLGLRGPQISREKPVGVRRIALLGESAAFGYLASDGQEAARLLESRLRAAGYAIEVINAAVPGYNLCQTTPRFRDQIAPLEPDFVILYLGWNDLGYVVSGEPEARQFRVRPVAPAWQRLLGRSTLYGLVFHRILSGPARLPPAELVTTDPTPAGVQRFQTNLDELASAVRAAGAQLVVCAQASAAHPMSQQALRAALNADPQLIEPMIRLGQWLHDALDSFAQNQGALFVDAYREIPPTEEMLADYVHLTPAGEQRLAELLAGRLAALLVTSPPLAAETEG